MNSYKGVFSKIIFLILFPLLSIAQDDDAVEMADSFRDEGKIYVVIGIIAIILLGLIIYLASIDKKVKKLERRMKREK